MRHTAKETAQRIADGRLSDTAMAILTAVRNAPRGLPRREIASMVSRHVDTVETYLAALRDQGLVASTEMGVHSVWTVPEMVQHVREARRAMYYAGMSEADALRRQTKAEWNARSRLRRQRDIETVTVRVLPAADAPRLVTRAPISVFHLGGAL